MDAGHSKIPGERNCPRRAQCVAAPVAAESVDRWRSWEDAVPAVARWDAQSHSVVDGSKPRALHLRRRWRVGWDELSLVRRAR